MKLRTKVKAAKSAVKKKSPEILIIGGVLMTIAGVVITNIETTKATKKIKEAKEELNNLDEALEDDIKKKESRKIKLKTAGSVALTYAPGVILTAAGITCMTGSSIILKKRNATLATAYTALSTTFDEYRERVKEKIGSEKESDIYYDAKDETVEIIDENGKKKKVKKKIYNPNGSKYAVFFDRENWDGTHNYEFREDYQMNVWFINKEIDHCNNLLKYQDLSVNDVYSRLGIGKGKAAYHQLDGWPKGSKIEVTIVDGPANIYDNGPILLDFNAESGVWA